MTTIVIPYTPRALFKPYHNRIQRFAINVVHRRAGKTVACINDLIKKAMECQLPDPRLAYVAPLYNQAKDVAWTYLKKYSKPLWASPPNESELRVDLIKGARIRLYGADNPDRMRGLYLDDVVLDEYADMNPAIWGEVIRPLLADRHGGATFIGTPKGFNSFYDIYERAKKDSAWFHMMVKASESGLVLQAELDAARKDMTKDQYAQEFECSFEAAITGAVYGEWMNEANARIQVDVYDDTLPVNTAWDLGYDDATAIWFYQLARGEVRLIDYYENNQQDIPHYCEVLKAKPYRYLDHYVPHDAANKLLAAGGQSIVQQAFKLGVNMKVVPSTSQQNSIEAARKVIGICWFDSDKCASGINALRQYQFEFDGDKKTFRSVPRHDWSSHAADAFELIGRVNLTVAQSPTKATPRYLNDMTANELFWPKNESVKHRERI